jgi:hypothetical protein
MSPRILCANTALRSALCQWQACGNEAASVMWKASNSCVSRKAVGELSPLGGYELFQFARYLRWIVGLTFKAKMGTRFKAI